MISFIKYKLFEKRILRELENTPSFRLMMNISISPLAYESVFQDHAEKYMGTTQRYKLAKKLGRLVDKTDIKTIGMLYAYFLWLYVCDQGKMRNVSKHDDELRQLRIEYGLNNFNLVERNGFYTLAPIDYEKYDKYLKNEN